MASSFPPKKGAAFTLYFTLYKNDGTVIANPGTMTRAVSIDGGAVDTTPANAITEEDTTYGQISWVLSADEMNGDAIWVYAKDDTAGCVPFTATLYTAANTQDELGTSIASILDDTGTAGVVLAADAITAAKIADNAIAAEHIADDAIVAANLATGCITADAFAADAIVAATLATDAITDDAIATGAIASTAFAAGAINAAAIADGAIDNATFAADVGTTAYATNVIGLAARKALDDYDPPTKAEMDSAFSTTNGKVDAVDDLLDTEVAAITAAVITNAAGADVAADIIALKTVADTIAADTTTDIPATITALQGDVTDILADTNELQTNQGNWLTATGFSTLDAAGVRTAVGMADADLDTQLAALPTDADVETAAGAALTTYDPPTKAEMDTALAGLASDTDVADAVWDELLSGHTSAGSAGLLLGTTLPNAIDAVDNYVDTEVGALATELAKVPKSDSNVSWNATALAAIQGEATDALNAYDPPTATELTNGLAALNDLDAAGIRTAVGMASANLDTQLGALPTAAENADAVWDEASTGHTDAGKAGQQVWTDVDAILADTNELQTNQGNWLTATGFSTHSAADVWSAGTRTLTAIDEDATTLDIDAAVQAAAGAALTAYDPPTKAELDSAVSPLATAASVTALNDFDPASDVVAHVTLVDTTTTNTDMVTAAPAAADVADAVWDEAIAGHAGVGSTGATLSAAGTAGDPWSIDIPGAYADGTAGQKLGDIMDDLEDGGRTDLLIDAIKAQTDALDGYTVTVVSPVADSGTVTLYAGDDYDNAHGRALTFSLAVSGVPDLTAATVVMKTQESSWTATSCTSDGTDWTVLFEPTAADTAALGNLRQTYEVEATLSDGDVATLVTGTLVVNRDVA